MKIAKVQIVNKSNNPLPKYETEGSVGMDVCANLQEGIIDYVIILPGNTAVIPTGLFVAIPDGYEIQVRSRSGLAAKAGIHVLNSPGTIDSDYRGEVKIILHNTSPDNFKVKHGDRIAQLVLSEKPIIEWDLVTALPETKRGSGGLGSTGVK